MLFSLSNNLLLYQTDGTTGASQGKYFVLLDFVIPPRSIKLIDRPHGCKAGPQDLTNVMRSIGLLYSATTVTTMTWYRSQGLRG